MNKKEIPLMFCFDNNYVIPAAVAFYSLLEHCNKNYYYKLYILHTDISLRNQKKLKENVKEFSEFSELIFVNMANRFDDLWKSIQVKGHFSKEVMYKVLVASIFPQYDKIIVSDVDVVFLNDISESYFELETEENYYLAGVKVIGKMQWYMDTYLENFSKEEVIKLSGFCGGYIVFNLKKIREDNMEQKFIECFKKEGYRIYQMEQDILNLCCYPKTKKLPLKYVACSYMWDEYKTEKDKETDTNYSKEEIEDAMNNTVQLHYATSIKPWKNVDCTKGKIWFEYIVKTNFLEEYLQQLPEKMVLPNSRIKNIEDTAIEITREDIKDDLLENYTLIKRIITQLEIRKSNIFARILKNLLENPFFFVRPSFYRKIYREKVIKRKKENYTLLIVDDVFPSFYSPFRTEEFINYFNEFKNVYALATWKAIPDTNEATSKELINKFEQRYPNLTEKIIDIKDEDYEEKIKKLKNKIAIMVFIDNVIEQLEFIEKNKIPFVFTIYPDRDFEINSDQTNKKLKRIFSSKFFRKVIVTDSMIKEYLVKNNFCTNNKIKQINGEIMQKEMFHVRKKGKKYYKYNKNTLDICFAEYEHFNHKRDDGYKIFIEAMKKLEKFEDLRIHIIGKHKETDVDIRDISNKIKFYRIRNPEWFLKFYKNIDIVISPNNIKKQLESTPNDLCVQAMLSKVMVMATKNVDSKNCFIDNKDFIVINPEVNSIVEKIKLLHNQPKIIRRIAKSGNKKAEKNYSYERQMIPRYNLIRKIAKKEER